MSDEDHREGEKNIASHFCSEANDADVPTFSLTQWESLQ